MKKLDRVASCMQGIVRPLKESKDDAFAQGLSGDGVLVTPTYNKVISPFKGKVVFVFDTLHAIILRRDSDGLAFVLHVGYETNKLTGKEFKVPVKTGDDVVAGDVINHKSIDKTTKFAQRQNMNKSAIIDYYKIMCYNTMDFSKSPL